MIGATLTISPDVPAAGGTVTATYEVTGNDAGVPVTYGVPVAAGLVFVATADPAVFTAAVPAPGPGSVTGVEPVTGLVTAGVDVDAVVTLPAPPPPPPATPTVPNVLPVMLPAVPHATTVGLSWQASPTQSADSGYHYQVLDATGTVVVADGRTPGLAVTVPGLSPVTGYTWRLAMGQDSEHLSSGWSAPHGFTTLSAAGGPMPVGVPPGLVGALLLDADGAEMLAWEHTQSGNQGQNKPGVYGLDSAADLSLAVTGETDTFCQVWGPAFGPEGIYEAKVFLPDDGTGMIADWPAWWLYGSNGADELDIIEGLAGKSAVHLWWKGGNAGGGWMTSTRAESGTSICKPGWHTGTAVITATQVLVYLDGVLFSTFNSQPLVTALHVIHDIMGARSGQAAVPATYLAAYTRVWALA